MNDTAMSDSDTDKGGIYCGTVRHFRFRPKKHRLAYRVYTLLLDVDALDRLDQRLALFSRNRFNLFSFYDRDHGSGKPDDIGVWVRDQLAQAGLESSKILMLCYPRVLGYAFNPITVYYCYHDDRLVALIYAVRNTFGGRHSYLIPVVSETYSSLEQKNTAQPVIRQSTAKRLHVSPFVDMPMHYAFTVSEPAKKLSLAIGVSDQEGVLLNTSFGAEFMALTDASLRRCFWRFPLVTIKVIGAIHWEAVKLVAKGLRLRAGDPDPIEPVTIVRSETRG